MSSGKLHKLYDRDSYMEISKLNFNISEIVIPFSKLFKNYKSPDIYSGVEKIPFKERDPEFKTILRQEFANFI